MDVLAGVDAVPWETLHHCFDASDDIPDLLRKVAAGSEEALDELGGYMVHQGTLYEATPYLVRFLARIAASGTATAGITAGILDLLGIAASSDTEGQELDVRGKTRASLAGEISVLLPLLAASSSRLTGPRCMSRDSQMRKENAPRRAGMSVGRSSVRLSASVGAGGRTGGDFHGMAGGSWSPAGRGARPG